MVTPNMRNFSIPLQGNAILNVTIEERLEEILLRQLRCGEKFKQEVTRRIGVREEHYETLEAAIKSSLGITGIAQLESNIKSVSGLNVSLEQMTETKETIEVQAPCKGFLLLLIYQWKQIFHFQYFNRRWFGFGTDQWTYTIEKWLPRIFNDSKKLIRDPNCTGEQEPELGFDGRITMWIGDKLGLVTGIKLVDDKVIFPEIDLATDSDLNQLFTSRAELPTDAIPQPSRFLAAIEEQSVDVTFSPSPMRALSSMGIDIDPVTPMYGHQHNLPRSSERYPGWGNLPNVHQWITTPEFAPPPTYGRPPAELMFSYPHVHYPPSSAYSYGSGLLHAFPGYVQQPDVMYRGLQAHGMDPSELPRINLHRTT